MDKVIVSSVHGIVDFLLRRGSIDNRIYNNSSMAEGTRIHLRYQKMQDGSYLSEEPLSMEYKIDGYTFIITGRADGIIVSSKKRHVIDEIKSTVIDLEEYYEEQKDWHLGQAKFYAYMYAKKNYMSEIDIKLTYISQKDEGMMIKTFTCFIDDLEEFVHDTLSEYLSFYINIDKHCEEKRRSADDLVFPFDSFRKGQKELSKYVYGTIINDDSLFVEAPTGIGKTISTLFPACKTFSSGKVEKIFYLSAKAIAKDVAFETIKKIKNAGLVVKAIKLNAKDRMCQTGNKKCNPDECPFAKGYYDKVKNVLERIILEEDMIDDNVIYRYANTYDLCAFEFQLDVSLFCDVIICDYNYLFDPLVYLKRFFEVDKTPYIALIDEAHNLVDRSRDMYSADFDLGSIKLLQRQFKAFKHPKIKRAMKKIISYLNEQEFEENSFYLIKENGFESELYNLLQLFFKHSQDILKNYPDYSSDLFLEVFRMTNRFLKISEFVNESFVCYYEKTNESIEAKIKCIDSSSLINETLKKIKASVFFSATLTPMEYYVKCLGGNDDTPIIKLDSPFSCENRLVIVRNDISTRYKDRDNSYLQIARTIEEIASKKKGNYLVFFSSYQYLENVYSRLSFNKDVNYIKQSRDMLEKDRNMFLLNFCHDPDRTTIGFAVLGGVFSEGIDLQADKLIGAIVVGVGLPQISFERDLIKDYYSNLEMNGYDYSYVNPGINKILQAAGRVIRSETDKGIIVFIDDRYSQYKYKDILKKQYKEIVYSKDEEEISLLVDNFWQNH